MGLDTSGHPLAYGGYSQGMSRSVESRSATERPLPLRIEVLQREASKINEGNKAVVPLKMKLKGHPGFKSLECNFQVLDRNRGGVLLCHDETRAQRRFYISGD